MPWDLLIRGGDVVTPDGVRAGTDVAIEDERIVEVAPDLRGAAHETIDAIGLHVFPGLIDPHVHFNEPGRTDWEGFETGSSALAAGGGTCFFDMPLNSSPPTLDGESFDLKLAAAEANSRTDFALWGGLTPNNLDKMEELADRGVVGFKAFMSSSGIEDFARADDLTLYRGMEIANSLGLPVAVHAENDDITSGLAAEAVAAGRTGVCDYLKSRPVVAELEAIRRAIQFSLETECKLHIVHVSSPSGIAVVLSDVEGSDADVTCETCPHYLAFSEDDLGHIGLSGKCAPPLRSPALVDFLWGWLSKGRIDFVASDHSPSPPAMKATHDWFKAWGGIAGVQSTRAVLLSRQPAVPLPHVARLTAAAVAERFGIESKGRVKAGLDADFALIHLASTFELRRNDLLDRHKLSPYVGRTFRGVVKRTIVRGHTVFQDGKIVAGDFRGRLVKPERARKAGAA
jgi:allantoinase